MSNYSEDEELMKSLQAGDRMVVKEIYDQYRHGFTSFVQKAFQCDGQKAGDVYPESFSILYFNIKLGKLRSPLKSTLKTYLYAIGKHIYHKRNFDKYQSLKVPVEELQAVSLDLVTESLEKKERAIKMKALLNTIGEPCQKLLELFYYRSYSFEAITKELKENEGRLRKRKYDCLRKLHALIEQHKIIF